MLTGRRLAIADLVPDPANPRTHSLENLQAIAGRLRRFGQAEPLVVQSGSQRVIAGQGRLAAMRELGRTEAHIAQVPVDDLGATSLAIAFDRTGELAGWNDQVLVKLLDELTAQGELEVTGFSTSDLDDLIAEVEAKSDLELAANIDQVPEPSDETATRPGDLWILGDHRLLCGDSSKADVAGSCHSLSVIVLYYLSAARISVAIFTLVSRGSARKDSITVVRSTGIVRL